jgi:hypothetical protein
MSKCNNPVPSGATCPVCSKEHRNTRRAVTFGALIVVAILVIGGAFMVHDWYWKGYGY